MREASVVTQALAAPVRSGFERLPTEEHVCVCTVDGERVRCFGGEVRERVVRCGDCVHFSVDEAGPCCKLLDFSFGDAERMSRCFCSFGMAKEDA